jgi:(p)ppGpp synthase/HD superfamily hydrolase
MHEIEKTLLCAVEAHQGQVDKAGQPYILHPLRLIASLKTQSEQKVALLHDVLEDTDMTLTDLTEKCNLTSEESEALMLLCHAKHEPYFEYLIKIRENPLALAVKTADLTDNSHRTAFGARFLDYETWKRLTEKYIRGYHVLVHGMSIEEVRVIGFDTSEEMYNSIQHLTP